MKIIAKDPRLYIESDPYAKSEVFTEIKESGNGWKHVLVVVTVSRWQKILRSIKRLFTKRKEYTFDVRYKDEKW